MVSTLGHGVGVAPLVVTVGATSDDTLIFEPLPGSCNLTTIATEGQAVCAAAAGSGIGRREHALVSAAGGDAVAVVEGLGGAVSPAGAAIGLVAGEKDQ